LPPQAINQAFWQFSPLLSGLSYLLWPLHLVGKFGASVALRV